MDNLKSFKASVLVKQRINITFQAESLESAKLIIVRPELQDNLFIEVQYCEPKTISLTTISEV